MENNSSSLLSSTSLISLTTQLQYKNINDISQLHEIIQNLLEDKKYLEKALKIKEAKIEFLENKLKQQDGSKTTETIISDIPKKTGLLTENNAIKVENFTNINNNIYLDNFKDKDIEDYISDIKQLKTEENTNSKSKKKSRNNSTSKGKVENNTEKFNILKKKKRTNNFKEICHKNQLQIRSISANAKSKVKEYITNTTISPVNRKTNEEHKGIYIKKKIGNKTSTLKENETINCIRSSHTKSKSMVNFTKINNTSRSISKEKSKKVEVVNNSKIVLRNNKNKSNKKNIALQNNTMKKPLVTKSHSSLLSLKTSHNKEI